MNVFLLLNTKEDILKNMGNQTVDGSCIEWGKNKYYECQWGLSTLWLPTFFKLSSFVFNRRKKFIRFWNNLKVSKLWQNFHVWVNYPFKAKTKLNHDRKNTANQIKTTKEQNYQWKHNGNKPQLNAYKWQYNRKLRITPHTTQISHNNTIKDTKQ